MKDYLEDIVGDESDEEIDYSIFENNLKIALYNQLIGMRIPTEEIPWGI